MGENLKSAKADLNTVSIPNRVNNLESRSNPAYVTSY
jgi:hypothetical protein